MGYSKELTAKAKEYFKRRLNLEISDTEAESYLKSLSLFGELLIKVSFPQSPSTGRPRAPRHVARRPDPVGGSVGRSGTKLVPQYLRSAYVISKGADKDG
jgi:hypothetical protein